MKHHDQNCKDDRMNCHDLRPGDHHHVRPCYDGGDDGYDPRPQRHCHVDHLMDRCRDCPDLADGAVRCCHEVRCYRAVGVDRVGHEVRDLWMRAPIRHQSVRQQWTHLCVQVRLPIQPTVHHRHPK